MQKQRKKPFHSGILSLCFFSIFVVLLGHTSNPKGQNCGHNLKQHPANEIFSAHTTTSRRLQSPDFASGGYSNQARLRILENSSLSSKYKRILSTAKEKKSLYKLCLVVLSEFESTPIKPEHYEGWVKFLDKSSAEELSHRIFEGIHLLILSRLSKSTLSFEPEKGFFYDTQIRKTMDVQIRDPETDQVISYNEVKQSNKHESAKELIRSVIKKTMEIRPKVGPEVELSGIIFLGSEIAPDNFSGIEAGNRFYQTHNFVRGYLNHRLETTPNLSLDSVTLIDVVLEQYVKFYLIDGRYVEVNGDYPLAAFLR